MRCPVLLLHGLESDALLPPTIARMRRERPALPFTVAHVPDTDHTPVLADRNQTGHIHDWLQSGGRESTELSLPHAWPRQDWRCTQDSAKASSARKCASA